LIRREKDGFSRLWLRPPADDHMCCGVNLVEAATLLAGTGSKRGPVVVLPLNTHFTERHYMRKLIPILVAAVFALSGGAAFAASHTGAKPMDSKDEMKKSDKKSDKKAKKSSKKSSKKAAKKDEMAK
jgi:mannitol-specific phosphotransferase system IIBC component